MAAQTLTIQYGSDPQKTVSVSAGQDSGLTYLMGQLNAQRTADNPSRVAAGVAVVQPYATITEMLKDVMSAYCAAQKAALKQARLDAIAPGLENATNQQLATVAATINVTLP